MAPRILALGVNEWSALCSGRITPGINSIGGWVGPRVGLDAMARRKNTFSLPAANRPPPPPGRPARSIVTILTELSRLP
jgi:hypothetical protein